MNTIEIYCNYGVLAAEKRNVYTFGAEHPHATCSDKMTVVVPDGWKIYQNQMGQTMTTAPWGWDYDINEVLTDINGRAAFWAMDKNMSYKTAYLFTPEELEEKEEKEKEENKKKKLYVQIQEDEPIKWRYEEDPYYLYYCTNDEREGIFEVNLRENSRSQKQGTIDFTLHGESEKKIKQYFNYKYGKKYNVEFVEDILATTGYYI